ncbi:MAG: hypothetical protein ACKVQS_05885 [Fimbriimonadaceae bacterium]
MEESEDDLSNVKPGVDVLDVIYDYFKNSVDFLFQPGTQESDTQKIIEKAKKSGSKLGQYVAYRLKVADLDSETRIIKGCIDRGHGGLRKVIYNAVEQKQVHEQKEEELDFSPLHFYLWIPKGQHKAILFTQKSGVMSCQGAVHFLILQATKSAKCLPIEVKPFLPKGWIKKYIEGDGVKSVTFDVNLDKLYSTADDLWKGMPGSIATLRVTPNGKKERFKVDEVISALGRWEERFKNIQKAEGGNFVDDNPLGETEITLDVGDGKERKWKHGSNEFSYPVLFFDDAILENGHVQSDYFFSKCSEVLTECRDELYGISV